MTGFRFIVTLRGVVSVRIRLMFGYLSDSPRPPAIDRFTDFGVCGFGADFQHSGHLIEAFAAEAELAFVGLWSLCGTRTCEPP